MNRKPSIQSKLLRVALFATVALVGIASIFATILPTYAAFQPVLNSGDADAHIETLKQETGNTTPPEDDKSCSIFSDGLFACAIYWILDAISDWVLAGVVNLVGGIFNAFVDFAFADLASTAFVQVGFGITLGVANMFFVLILLWIAVATIFDFEPYTARSLLPKLIIAALLINFSLAIGNTFIKLSNGIAAIFHQRLTGNGTKYMYNLIADAAAFAKVQDTTPDDLPNVTSEDVAAIKISAREKPESRENTLELGIASRIYKLAISPVFIFVMLAGALFILIRQISLMFLLVLGPLAFLFMILPATSGMWSSWWQKLFRWSFFLPAYMFFVFLSLTVGANLGDAASQGHQAISIWIQYGMTIALMIGSLLVANQMGIYGAGAVNAIGKRMSKGAGKWAAKGAGHLALSRAAPAAQRVISGEGRIAQTLRAIPGASRLAAQATSMQRSVIEQRQKELTKYNPEELKRIMGSRGTTANTRAAALQILQQKRDLRNNDAAGFNGARIRTTIEQMNAIGMDTRNIQRQRPDVAIPNQGELQTYATRRVASQANPQDIENMEESIAQNRDAVLGLVDRVGPQHVQKLADRNDQLTDAFVQELHGLDASGARDSAVIAARLREVSLITGRARNEGLARFVESDTGRGLLGLRQPPSPQPSPPPATATTPPPSSVVIAPEEGTNRRSRSRLNPETGEMEDVA